MKIGNALNAAARIMKLVKLEQLGVSGRKYLIYKIRNSHQYLVKNVHIPNFLKISLLQHWLIFLTYFQHNNYFS